jgi:hypothetical protein
VRRELETYVAEAFALQGVPLDPAAAARIAGALDGQMAIVASVYAALPFEAEPSGFLRALDEAVC